MDEPIQPQDPPQDPPEGPEPPPEDPPQEPPEDKGGVQKRIDELTRKRREAEREAAYWRGVAEAKAAAKSEPPKPATDDLDPNDFDSDADYLRAVAAKAKEEIKKELEEERKRERELATQTRLTSLYSKGRKEHPDFDDVALNPSLPVTQHMFDAAMGDNLPDLLYYLGKNPAEASRIASLPPTQQIKEIGKIESGLTKKAVPGAPPPPTTVSGGSSGPVKDEKDMTRAELHAKWEKERRARLGIR